jgi:superfamily I DNA/RNA helicase
LGPILQAWLETHAEGTACVIGTGAPDEAVRRAGPRIRSLSPELSKGLEFDLVVLVDPDTFGPAGGGMERAVDRYVAMTRATQQLVIVTGE